jgi:hypothetical protein
MRPLWLALDGEGYPLVISGGRRLAALRALGKSEVPCLAPANASRFSDSAFLVMAALTDNLGRGYNQAELALAWDLAKNEAPRESWKEIAKLLGFHPKSPKLSALESAARLPAAALEALAKGDLDPENAPPLLEFADSERQLVLNLFARVRPSRQNRRLWLEWLSDLRDFGAPSAAPSGAPKGPNDLTKILAAPELQSLAGPSAEKAVRDYLKELRFPLLADLSRRRRQALKDLNLPEGLKLELDPEFEDVTASLRLTFSDAQKLGRLAEAARQLAQGDALGRLWNLGNTPAGPGRGPSGEGQS